LRLDTNIPELHAIPWELLRDDSNILAAKTTTPFSRYLAGKWPIPPPIAERPLLIAVAIANPENLSDNNLVALDETTELALLQEATAKLDAELIPISQPCTLSAIETALRQGCHILHIVAHGTFNKRKQQAGLYLADENNQATRISETEFAEMVGRAQTNKLRLITLSSCQTATRSPAEAFRGFAPTLIANGLPAVLAMQDNISIKTARGFFQTFYERLLIHGQVDLACNEARATLLTNGLLGSGVPVLFSRLIGNRLVEETAFNTPQTEYIFSGLEDVRTMRNRAAMLDKVYHTWVDGVLEQSLHGAALIALGMEEQPDKVDHYPWGVQIQRGEQKRQQLPANTKIAEIFKATDYRLLILGEPGGGKTTMLLELARQAIDEAKQHPANLIPVFLNLSSWGSFEGTKSGGFFGVGQRNVDTSFKAWLIAELSTIYNHNPETSEQWIKNNDFLYLLDGLDEIIAEKRNNCVQAINQFIKKYQPQLAVCCRTKDYELLGNRLTLHSAIYLQPLTQKQIDKFLAYPSLSAVRSYLDYDEPLQKLVQSPLMLSIISLAYKDKQINELGQFETIETRRYHLFETYIQTMLNREVVVPDKQIKGRLEKTIPTRFAEKLYSDEDTIHWLSWLARNLMEHGQSIFLLENGQSIFLLENLQPSYLNNKKQIAMYSLLVQTIFLFISITIAYIYAILNSRDDLLLQKNTTFNYSYFYLSFLGVVLWTGLIWFSCMKRVKNIEIVEKLHISKKEFLEWLDVITGGIDKLYMKGVFIGAVLNGVVGYYYYASVSIAIIFCILGGFLSFIAIGLFLYLKVFREFSKGKIGGVNYVTISQEERSTPNQGIYNSVKNGIVVMGGFIVVLSFLWITALILNNESFLELLPDFLRGLFFLSVLALPFGIGYGIFTFIQHLSLRLLLITNNVIPIQYIHFLDYATERIFLRKVGGGYVFIHRLLLEHFAGLAESRTNIEHTEKPQEIN